MRGSETSPAAVEVICEVRKPRQQWWRLYARFGNLASSGGDYMRGSETSPAVVEIIGEVRKPRQQWTIECLCGGYRLDMQNLDKCGIIE